MPAYTLSKDDAAKYNTFYLTDHKKRKGSRMRAKERNVTQLEKLTTNLSVVGEFPWWKKYIKSYPWLDNLPFVSSLRYHYVTLRSHHTQLYKML